MNPAKSPLLIGATGGSGTRLFKAVLGPRLFGGLRVNAAGDTMDFVPFYNRYISPTLQVARRVNYQLSELPSEITRPAIAELRQAIAAFCADLPSAHSDWMIKNPRSMYMLPYFAELFPQLRFLHVLRDGRDMALSSNQNQLTAHYRDLFDEAAGDDSAVASAKLWSRTNCDVAQWGETNLQQRYRRVRYEDICQNPQRTASGVYAWLGLTLQPSDLTTEIHTHPEIGRWRQLPPDRIAAISEACRLGLERFGYG